MRTKYKIPNKLYSFNIDSERLFELDDEGNSFFNQALEVLDESINEKKALLVYRGENRDNLNEKLVFIDSNDLFDKLFHVGDKSKYFIKSNLFKRYLNDINDVSDGVFKIIFDKICEKQNSNNVISDFKSYFTNIDNKENFIKKVTNLNDKSKLRIRDYYFSYLHQEEIDGNRSSFFVSTSKDIEVAEDERYTGEEDNKILIYYFIPKPYIDVAIYSKNEPILKKYCVDSDLPIYPIPFDGLEDEVCVKGALEPRHILGVTTYINRLLAKLKKLQWSQPSKPLTLRDLNYHWIEFNKEEVFVVNPYLFDFYENHLENFVKEGLPVDLERFYKIFPTTNCNGFFRFFKDNKFEEIK